MSESIQYVLDVRQPSAPPKRIPLTGKVLVGKGGNSNLRFTIPSLGNEHLVFRAHAGILTAQIFGGVAKTLLGNQELQAGKVYILDKGDKISIDEIEILIRTEEIEGEMKDPGVTGVFRTGDATADSSSADLNLDQEDSVTQLLDQAKLMAELEENGDSTAPETDINQEEALEDEINEELESEFIEDSEPVTEESDSTQSATNLEEDTELDEIDDDDFDEEESDELDDEDDEFDNELDDEDDEVEETPTSALLPPLAKLSSFLFMGSLTYLIVFILLPFLGLINVSLVFESLLNQFVPLEALDPILGPGSSAGIPLFILTFLILDLLFVLPLGRPLPYFLIGIRAEGEKPIKRLIGNIIRSIIGSLTWPLLVFDLLGLKRPSLKDRIAKTEYSYSKTSIIIGPLVLIVASFALINLHNFIDTAPNLGSQSFKNKVELDTSVSLTNSTLGLSYKGAWDSTIVSLPKIHKISKKDPPKLSLTFLDREGNWLNIQPKEQGETKDIAKTASIGNPLFGLSYPNLSSGNVAPEELKSLIEKAYKSDFLAVTSSPLDLFQAGYYRFRKFVLYLFPEASSFSFINTKKNSYFKVETAKNSYNLLSIDGKESVTFDVSRSPKAKDLERLIFSTILANASWKRSKPTTHEYPGMALMDLIANSNKKSIPDDALNELLPAIMKRVHQLGSNKGKKDLSNLFKTMSKMVSKSKFNNKDSLLAILQEQSSTWESNKDQPEWPGASFPEGQETENVDIQVEEVNEQL